MGFWSWLLGRKNKEPDWDIYYSPYGSAKLTKRPTPPPMRDKEGNPVYTRYIDPAPVLFTGGVDPLEMVLAAQLISEAGQSNNDAPCSVTPDSGTCSPSIDNSPSPSYDSGSSPSYDSGGGYDSGISSYDSGSSSYDSGGSFDSGM